MQVCILVADEGPGFRLSLCKGVSPPWLAATKGAWLYCQSCAQTRVGKEHPSKGFVTFRDRQSKMLLKGPSAKRPTQLELHGNQTSGVDEVEELDGDDAQLELVEDNDEVNHPEDPGSTESGLPDAALQDVRFPSIGEYRQKWKREEARRMKGNDEPFGLSNLVPEPSTALMQDVPWVPFDLLVSSEAQSRLSVVKPAGHPVRESEYVNGVEHFASKFGQALPRRHPAEGLHAHVEAIRSSVHMRRRQRGRVIPRHTRALSVRPHSYLCVCAFVRAIAVCGCPCTGSCDLDFLK